MTLAKDYQSIQALGSELVEAWAELEPAVREAILSLARLKERAFVP